MISFTQVVTKISEAWTARTWVIILELCHVVDISVDYDPEGVGLVVSRNIGLLECLRHYASKISLSFLLVLWIICYMDCCH